MKNSPRKAHRATSPADAKDEMKMNAARDKLKGILSNMVASEDVDEPEEEEQDVKPKSRGRPRKKGAAKSYIMKLFDRSVNVGRFDQDSPLYPICRAWIYDGQKPFPREQEPHRNVYYEGREPLLKAFHKQKFDRVGALPRPSSEVVARIPPPLKWTGRKIANFDMDYDLNDPPCSRKDIMNQHRHRWRNIKERWIQQMHNYEHRYAESIEVIDALAKY